MRQAMKSAAHIRLAMYGVIILVASASGGCISADAVKAYIAYNDGTNDFVMGWRNTVWARQAWHARKSQFVDEPQFHAFGQGFRDGYCAVASGGNGCPPPLPPRRYWNWRYQTAEGQAQVAAWFAGYPHGAQAADEEGAGLYQQIQVSHPIEVQYSPEFQQAIVAKEMLGDLMPGTPTPAEPIRSGTTSPPRNLPDLPQPQPQSEALWPGYRQPNPSAPGMPVFDRQQPPEIVPASYQPPLAPAAGVGVAPAFAVPGGGSFPGTWPGK